jgi:hypothetical protein
MSTNINTEYLPALERLEALNELSLDLLGIINIAGTEEILMHMAKRQELVCELCELDIFKSRSEGDNVSSIPPIVHNEFNKLLTAGEVLIKCCNQRLKEIENQKRQRSAVRTKARSYRPKPIADFSNCVVDT